MKIVEKYITALGSKKMKALIQQLSVVLTVLLFLTLYYGSAALSEHMTQVSKPHQSPPYSLWTDKFYGSYSVDQNTVSVSGMFYGDPGGNYTLFVSSASPEDYSEFILCNGEFDQSGVSIVTSGCEAETTGLDGGMIVGYYSDFNQRHELKKISFP